MILTDLADGESVCLDANVLIYHFAPHPVFGPACNDFVRRSRRRRSLATLRRRSSVTSHTI